MTSIGPYQLEGEIARGGMGIVYRGRGPQGPVALKVVLDTDPELRLRFRQELDVLRRLEHPAIVAFRELLQDERGRDVLVMELVEGESLAERLKRVGPLPLTEALDRGRQLCAAVEHAHRRRVLHRDLKPANVLVTHDGQLKLTDFGLGKVTNQSLALSRASLTGSGEVLGTPAYMPPEQALGDRAAMGPAADVYGIGATLFALLTGRPPFQGATAIQVLQLALDAPAPRASSLRPEVPAWLDAVVDRALAKDPAARFPSASALAAALAGPRARQRHWAAALTGLAVLGFAAGAAASAYSGQVRPPGSGAPPTGARSPTPPAAAPDPLAELRLRVQARLDARDFTAALAVLGELLVAAPDAHTHLTRASVYLELGRAAEALHDADAGLRLSPDVADLHFTRGRALELLGELALAEEAYDASLERAPEVFHPYLQRGLLRRTRRRPFDALADLDAALARVDSDAIRAEIHLARALTLRDLARPGGAYAAFADALELAPHRVSVLRSRIRLATELDDLALAIADVTRLLELEPSPPGRLLQRAELRTRAGDWAEALTDLDQLLGRSPDMARALLLRGRVRWVVGEEVAAQSDLRRALALEPSPLTALWVAALCGDLALLTDLDDERDPASAWQRRLVELYRGDRSVESLLQELVRSPAQERADAMCAVFSVAGLRQERDLANPGAAVSYYRDALATSARGAEHYAWARRRLADLARDPAPTPDAGAIAESLVGLGQAWATLDLFGRVVLAQRRATERDPDALLPTLALAETLTRLGEPVAALEHLAPHIERSPDWRLLACRADAYAATSDWARSELDFQQVAALAPDPLRAWIRLRHLFLRGRVAALLDAASEELARLPAGSPSQLLQWRALAHLWLGDLESAQADLLRVGGPRALHEDLWLSLLARDPEVMAPRRDDPIPFAAALARHALGELSDAELLRVVEEAAPEQRRAWAGLAYGFLGLREELAGRREQALTHYARCVDQGLSLRLIEVWARVRHQAWTR